MNVLFKLLVWAILVVRIKTDCDVCQTSNGVACHSRNSYSVCKGGLPTADYITCPDNAYCTSDRYVCYSEEEAVPSCLHNDLHPLPMEDDESLCGVCDEYKVFACLNETTIAFCFGDTVPNVEAVSYCPENTVCDINNAEYCSDSYLGEPSCVTSGATTTTTSGPTTTFDTTTTFEPTTPSEELTTSTTTLESTTTTLVPTTTTTSQTTTNTMDPTTTTTESTTPSITENPTTPTTTTILSTTTTTTTAEPTTTTTITTDPTTTSTTTTETTTAATTTTDSTTTTTTAAVPRDPNTICKDAGSIGSYKTDDDVTCTKFVVCYTISGELRGIVKSCPSGQYFHPEMRVCTTVKPDGC